MKIKWKLNFFFIITIVLLFVRLFGVIPLIIDYHRDDDVIIPSVETIIFWFTEFFPIVVLMFSFITFGSSSKDNIESIEEHYDIVERSSSNIPTNSDNFENHSRPYSINSSINECNKTHLLVCQLKFDECKQLDPHAASEQVNASILSQEIETDDEVSFKKRDTIPKGKSNKSDIQSQSEGDGFNNNEGLNFRDDNLKWAFNQMVGEMGVNRASDYSLSALDEDSD